MSAANSLKALETVSKEMPSLRLGQLIWNATNGEDLFYMTDSHLQKVLYNYLKEHRG